jgi:hypothetical protein
MRVAERTMSRLVLKLAPIVLMAGCMSSIGATPSKQAPLPDGDYTFTHRFAEQPAMPSITMHVRIRGRRVIVTNDDGPTDVFAKGVVDEGLLLWHAASQQWIIGDSEADKDAPEVGGCSGGPEVIDLAKKIYWTC